MNDFAVELNRLLLDLAWSLWCELGATGGVRRHDSQATDLEPLILFTAWLEGDNRLRASAVEWCIENARFASTFRLRQFAARASPPMLSAFGRFSATVGAHSRAPWPGEGRPFTLLRRDEIRTPDLRRPSLIQLRLRALVGVSARAEILKKMLAEPDRAFGAAALAEDAGYGKGSLAQALDMLTIAGIVLVQPAGNRLLYRLARPAELAQALGWLPSSFPDWWPVFRVLEGLWDYSHSSSQPIEARVPAVRAVLDRIAPDLHRLRAAERMPRMDGAAAGVELEHWGLEFAAGWSGRAPGSGGGRDVSYVVHHLSFGGWILTVDQNAHGPREIEVDGKSQLDDKAGAWKLAHAMFADALGRFQPVVADAALVEAKSREFAEETLRPMPAGQEATFTAEFVRRWYENRQQRFGATA